MTPTLSKSEKMALVARVEYLDKLVHDPDWEVRKAVAEMDYGHDILIRDADAEVRLVVARRGIANLTSMINDPSWLVRQAVAQHGYGLDILVNDPQAEVRIAAQQKLDEKRSKSKKKKPCFLVRWWRAIFG